MTDDTAAAVVATRESPDDAKSAKERVTQWLDAISVADEDEKDWRKKADDVVKIYRQGSTNRYGDGERLGDNDRTFNILHANVETIVPSIYNSTPAPDVRRRFNDSDPVGKQVADILERALALSVDSYDFDAAIRATVYDMELPGRGVDRVRYVPYLSPDQASVAYEEVQCEHVPWKHFRRGPARMWADVPWIAFELFLTRDELEKLSPSLGSKVQMDAEVERADRRDGQNIPDIYKRARVWEIWDKDSKKVVFIATGYKDKPIREEDDPLQLTGFFPIPRPLYAIETSDTLVPVTPYSIYEDQAEELERVSRRIMALVEQIKVRAVYDGQLEGEISSLSQSEDGALIPLKNIGNYATSGPKALEGAFAFWPMENAIIALKQLYEQREQIKQAIYEITGIADIMRGQTNASETLGAQQLKTQWGSLRVQRKQAEVQRYVRDLFRIKAEIIATKFQWQTIVMMTGLQLPLQAQKDAVQAMAARAQQTGQPVPPALQQVLSQPSQEEVQQLLRNDAMRGFRVDIESDSTIRADLTRNQTNMNLFLQGTAQYGAAMGPIIQELPAAMPAVLQIYQAFARNFKLGKQAEDTIEQLGVLAQQAAQQPKPDPEAEKAQAEMALERERLQIEREKAANDMRLAEAKLQNEMKLAQMKLAAEIEMEQERCRADLIIGQHEMVQKAQLQQQDMALKAEGQQQEMEMKGEESENNMQIKRQEMAFKADAAEGGESPSPARASRRAGTNQALMTMFGDISDKLTEAITMLAQAQTAPRRVVRGPDGRIVGSETVQ